MESAESSTPLTSCNFNKHLKLFSMLGFRDENKSEFARLQKKNLRNIKIRMTYV